MTGRYSLGGDDTLGAAKDVHQSRFDGLVEGLPVEEAQNQQPVGGMIGDGYRQQAVLAKFEVFCQVNWLPDLSTACQQIENLLRRLGYRAVSRVNLKFRVDGGLVSI